MDVIKFFKELQTFKICSKKWASDYVIDKKHENKYLKINFSMRSNNGFMGRFGGGWNWKLGFQAGGKTVILSFLIADLRISLK